MGGCFSGKFNRDDHRCSRTAKVITIGGGLREYGVPVTATQVLRSGSLLASSAAATRFVCSSDRLFYDEFIPTLDPEEELTDDQIYFVLPRSRLRERLTASDMVALAAKASVAMQKAEEKRRRRQRRKGTRISPALEANREAAGSVSDSTKRQKRISARIESGEESQVKVKMVRGRSESLWQLRKYPSRRLTKAVRSFRIRLSTIPEGTADIDVLL